MKEDIKKILEYGVMAPSGDNSQPWRFELQDDTLFVYNLPDKDNPYLNYQQSGSLIAHGALLTNIRIAAQEIGYSLEEVLFPGEENLVAKLTFSRSKPQKHPLLSVLPKRCTNRKPYSDKPIPQEVMEKLMNGNQKNIMTRFITDKKSKEKAARGGAMAEIVILENKTLHSYLFGDVVWSEKENQKKKSGLYIKTMEFNPVQKLLFYLAHFWSLMKIAIKLGLPEFIAKEDSKLYATGGALGIISTSSATPENFVAVGKEMQRIWLSATKHDLAFQPVTATLYFNFRAKEGQDSLLEEKHRKLLEKAYAKIEESFSLADTSIPLMMFRIGYAKKAHENHIRKEPIIVER